MEENEKNDALPILALITGAGLIGLMVVACVMALVLILILGVSLSGG
jgi:threonine dehydrogenase-like Zn-dependent dehydrogenase